MKEAKGKRKRKRSLYLVIGKKAGFLCVFACLSTTARRCMNTEIGKIRESEGTAVSRHADDQFLFGCPETDPHRRSVVHA